MWQSWPKPARHRRSDGNNVSDPADAPEPVAPPPAPRRKREWTPPGPECLYVTLEDFDPLYRIATSTAYRLAIEGKLPYLRVPGKKTMLFPRARVERILASWEANGGRRKRGPR